MQTHSTLPIRLDLENDIKAKLQVWSDQHMEGLLSETLDVVGNIIKNSGVNGLNEYFHVSEYKQTIKIKITSELQELKNKNLPYLNINKAIQLFFNEVEILIDNMRTQAKTRREQYPSKALAMQRINNAFIGAYTSILILILFYFFSPEAEKKESLQEKMLLMSMILVCLALGCAIGSVIAEKILVRSRAELEIQFDKNFTSYIKAMAEGIQKGTFVRPPKDIEIPSDNIKHIPLKSNKKKKKVSKQNTEEIDKNLSATSKNIRDIYSPRKEIFSFNFFNNYGKTARQNVNEKEDMPKKIASPVAVKKVKQPIQGTVIKSATGAEYIGLSKPGSYLKFYPKKFEEEIKIVSSNVVVDAGKFKKVIYEGNLFATSKDVHSKQKHYGIIPVGKDNHYHGATHKVKPHNCSLRMKIFSRDPGPEEASNSNIRKVYEQGSIIHHPKKNK